MQKPTCTSLNASCTPPMTYCRECSHALFYGEIIVNGRTHRFKYYPQFGPVFLTVMGTERVVQPAEDSQMWGEFEKWLNAQ